MGSSSLKAIEGVEGFESAPHLNYLHPSPVRGQLEPYKEKTRAGWRFLQCTDTPDELKVLLPPRTAQIYSQLLQSETDELTKQQDASWERILEIRRLKDRMIRKCRRLSRVWGASKQGSGTLFRTVYAPADFRLKEMERWIRYQENPSGVKSKPEIEQGLTKRSSVSSLKRRSSFCCDRCAAAGDSIDHNAAQPRRSSVAHSNRNSWVDPNSRRPASGAHRRSSTSSMRSVTVKDDRYTFSQTVYQSSNAIEDNIRGIHAILEPYTEPEIIPRRRSALFATDDPLVESPRVQSPEPLPHPYRSKNFSGNFVLADESSDFTDGDSADQAKYGARDISPSKEESVATRPPLAHRRSSLKKSSGSTRASLDVSKNVAWAMDQDWQDQVQKCDVAATEAETADRDWETERAAFEEEMANMQAVRLNLTETLARLRIETEQLEREEQVMKEQESKLREGYQKLEQTQLQYRTKVQTALDEARGVLSLAETKRST